VNKDDVLKYLKEAAEATESLKKLGAPGEEHTVWILTTKDLLKEVFGENSDFYKHFSGITYEYAGDSRFDSWYYKLEIEKLKKEAYAKGLAQAKGVLRSAITHIERFGPPDKK
jgi:hypothetical protein